MYGLEELKTFARDQKIIAETKLSAILSKIQNCKRVRSRNEIVTIPEEGNNQLIEEKEVFCAHLDGILKFYNEPLMQIALTYEKIENSLMLDFRDVELDPEKTQEEYEDEIRRGYSDVTDKVKTTFYPIIETCDFLINDLEENRFENLHIIRRVMVHLMVKFLIPMHQIRSILILAAEQASILNAPAPNPMDDNRKDTACRELKNLAKELIKKDNEIKENLPDVISVVRGGVGLTQTFVDDFMKFVKAYYKLTISYGMIPLNLCLCEVETGAVSRYQLNLRFQLIVYCVRMDQLRLKIEQAIHIVVCAALEADKANGILSL